jgi:hypothetical protein
VDVVERLILGFFIYAKEVILWKNASECACHAPDINVVCVVRSFKIPLGVV